MIALKKNIIKNYRKNIYYTTKLSINNNKGSYDLYLLYISVFDKSDENCVGVNYIRCNERNI